jgi:PKD repeat protein
MTALAISAVAAGCTMKSQEAPPLTGPSELGLSITVSVDPDLLVLDGSSQSRVTITVRDANGRPPSKRISLLSEILVDGVHTDFGSLSQRNLVTDLATGEATLMYTAPAAPAGPSVDLRTTVNIAVTPLGKDFGNSTTRLATIRLIPSGIVVPPDGLQPKFTFAPSAPTDNQNVLFDASTSTAPSNNPIVSYSWSFGDGATGSGRTATHSFNMPGTYIVTLTIVDQFNRTASTSQTIDVAGGAAPTAAFVTSPTAPRVGENVNFNASTSRPATGRTIRSYDWDFGDGTQKTTTGPTTAHDYQTAGAFTVTLVVTDDVGREAVATATVTVEGDSPTADFTFSQVPPTSAHTIQFNSSASSAISGRTIASYFWEFGDGSTSTLASPAHPYAGAASYNVTLTVTDSAGKTGRVTKSVSVQ